MSGGSLESSSPARGPCMSGVGVWWGQVCNHHHHYLRARPSPQGPRRLVECTLAPGSPQLHSWGSHRSRCWGAEVTWVGDKGRRQRQRMKRGPGLVSLEGLGGAESRAANIPRTASSASSCALASSRFSPSILGGRW